MLMPYLVLYRLSKWFSLTQGKLSQSKQYLALAFAIFSQFLILHSTQDFALRLSSPRQPGHGFLSLVNARHRRQFIPQGAISFAEIAVVFVNLFDVMPRSQFNSAPRYSASLATCSKSFVKCHNTTSLVFIERQHKNVLLRDAVDNHVRGTPEAGPLVVVGIAHEHAAFCTQ